MVNKNKQKGSNWERQLVDELNCNLPGNFKRVPGSGAFGTALSEGVLTGDVIGRVDGIPKQFRIECKTGYGGGTQLTVKKEWIDKIKAEAENTFAFPVLFCKFSGARSGVKQFAIIDFDTFIEMLLKMRNMEES